ncbi:MAG: hypothetical protein HC861_04530, partial [Rhodospirillaceae bacterium]|nr:hypothetical protein [Rhodospirillaceae bacterium]
MNSLKQPVRLHRRRLLQAGAGILGAAWGLEGLVVLSAGEFPEMENAVINPSVLAACAALSFFSGLFFTVVPAL